MQESIGDLDHILRAQVPWRPDAVLTECGRVVNSAMPVSKLQEKIDREGQRRAALTTCMKCWHRVSYHSYGPGGDDRVTALRRELDACSTRPRSDRRATMENDLRAIAALVELHREEFQELLGVVSLDDARQERNDVPR